MASKNLLGIAVAAATLAIAGCNTSSTDGSERVDLTPVESGQPGTIPNRFAPIFSAGNSDVPLNTDLLFGDVDTALTVSDGTAQTADTTPPVTTAINDLAGFSQTAAFDLEFNQPIDPATVVAGETVFLIELKNFEDNDAIDALSFTSIQSAIGDGVPFELPGGTGVNSGPMALEDYDVSVVQTNNNSEYYIRVTPLKPLNPRTKYIVAMTNGIKALDGRTAEKSAEFETLLSNDGLPSVRLVPVRKVAKATTSIASAYITAVTETPTSVDDIILTTSFTTNGGLLGLKSMANPTFYLSKTFSVAEAQNFLQEPVDVTLSEVEKQSLYVRLATALDINNVVDIPKPRPVTFLDPTAVDGVINTGAAVGAGDGGPLAPLSPITFALNDLLGDLTGDTIQITPTGASPAYFVPGQGDVFTRYLQGVIELPNYLKPVETTGGSLAPVLDAEFKVDFAAGDALGALATKKPDFVTGENAYPLGDLDVDQFENIEVVESNVTYRFPFARKQEVADQRERQVGADQTAHYAPFMLTVPARINYQLLASATSATEGALGLSPIARDCTLVERAPVVILVHGITTSRATSVGMGAILAANCVATLAIDLPLHGIAPTNASPLLDQFAIQQVQADNGSLAFANSPYVQALANEIANGDVAADSPLALVAERHDNIQQLADSTRVPMIFSSNGNERVGDSGSAFINFVQLTRTRDNIRQAVVDLLNLSASLPNFEAALDTLAPTVATASGTTDIPILGPLLGTLPLELGDGIVPLMKLDASNVSVAGHSLGAFVATAFAAVNNDTQVSRTSDGQDLTGGFVNPNLSKFTSLVLGNGGAHIAKSLENSPSLAPRVVDGLAAAGVAQGTSNFEKFLYIAQSALDEVDPAVAAIDLAKQNSETSILLFNMVGGGALPEDRTGIALADYVTNNVSFFLPDDTVPNFAYFGREDNPFAPFVDDISGVTPLSAFVPTADAPMVGTDGLAKIIGAETYQVGQSYTTTTGPLRIETRLKKGTHSTFAAADFFPAFAEMGVQLASFIDGDPAFNGQADDVDTIED